jgi:hypothetical protein
VRPARRKRAGDSPFSGGVEIVLGDLEGNGDLDAVVARWDWSEEPQIQVCL